MMSVWWFANTLHCIQGWEVVVMDHASCNFKVWRVNACGPWKDNMLFDNRFRYVDVVAECSQKCALLHCLGRDSGSINLRSNELTRVIVEPMNRTLKNELPKVRFQPTTFCLQGYYFRVTTEIAKA